MHQTKKRFLIASLGFLALFGVVLSIPGVIRADEVTSGLQAVNPAFPIQITQRAQNITTLIKLLLEWALYFSAIIAVAFIIIGGYTYITAGGNTEQSKKGRIALTNAIIGLVMIVFSYTVIQVIYNFLLNTR